MFFWKTFIRYNLNFAHIFFGYSSNNKSICIEWNRLDEIKYWFVNSNNESRIWSRRKKKVKVKFQSGRSLINFFFLSQGSMLTEFINLHWMLFIFRKSDDTSHSNASDWWFGIWTPLKEKTAISLFPILIRKLRWRGIYTEKYPWTDLSL